MDIDKLKNIINKIRRSVPIILKCIMWIIAGSIFLCGLVLGIATIITMGTAGNGGIALIAGLGFIIGGGIMAFTFISISILIYNTLLYNMMAREAAEKARKNRFDIDDLDIK